jgi:hypothetical protein
METNDKIREALQHTIPELEESSSPLEDDKENIYKDQPNEDQPDKDQPDDSPEIIEYKKRPRGGDDDGDAAERQVRRKSENSTQGSV